MYQNKEHEAMNERTERTERNERTQWWIHPGL